MKKPTEAQVMRVMLPMVAHWHITRVIAGPSRALLRFVSQWNEGLKK